MSRSAPGFLIVAAAAFDADRLGRRDLHVVDVAPVPERLENAVAEAEGQDVLDGFFAQVMIDAIDLALLENLVNIVVQFAGAGRDRDRTASR